MAREALLRGKAWQSVSWLVLGEAVREATLTRASNGDWPTLAALRAKQSKMVIDEIRTWVMTQQALPRPSLIKAISYTSGL